MNLNDLADDITKNTFIPKGYVAETLKEMIVVITEKLKQGEDVSIPKLGIFSVKHMGEKKGRNPRTGESITVPAHPAPKFRFSTAIKKGLR